MWDPKQAAACSCTEIHPLLVHASMTLVATNFHPSSSHMLTLLCSLTDFNRNCTRIKASPNLPQHMVNNPRSPRALIHGLCSSAMAPSCACTAQLTRQLIPQPTPGCPSAKASRHRLSPDKIRQQEATTSLSAAMLISSTLPKHGWKLPWVPWCSLWPSWLYKSWFLTNPQGVLIQKSMGNSSKVHSSNGHLNPLSNHNRKVHQQKFQ